MRLPRRLNVAMLGLLALLTLSAAACESSAAPAPLPRPRKDRRPPDPLAGLWHGWCNDSGATFTLELRPDGTFVEAWECGEIFTGVWQRDPTRGQCANFRCTSNCRPGVMSGCYELAGGTLACDLTPGRVGHPPDLECRRPGE